MLETYVLSLLAIWLTITIIGQLTGAYLGFDLIQKIKKIITFTVTLYNYLCFCLSFYRIILPL